MVDVVLVMRSINGGVCLLIRRLTGIRIPLVGYLLPYHYPIHEIEQSVPSFYIEGVRGRGDRLLVHSLFDEVARGKQAID